MRKTFTLAILSAALFTAPALAESFDVSVQAQCGKEWKAHKSNPVIASAGWPAYFSACAANHKAKGNTFAKRNSNKSGLDKEGLMKLIAESAQ